MFASGPVIQTFAKVPVEKGCECLNRTTGQFLPGLWLGKS
jgi:hypothetical protein